MTPRRRPLESPGGVSPKAKRAASYVPPQPAGGPLLTVDQVSQEMYIVKAALDSTHAWIRSIVEAIEDHAGQIETGHLATASVRNGMYEITQKLQASTSGAGSQLNDVFKKVDDILGELRAGDEQIKNTLEAKVLEIDEKINKLAQAMPPGLAGGGVGAAGGPGLTREDL